MTLLSWAHLSLAHLFAPDLAGGLAGSPGSEVYAADHRGGWSGPEPHGSGSGRPGGSSPSTLSHERFQRWSGVTGGWGILGRGRWAEMGFVGFGEHVN